MHFYPFGLDQTESKIDTLFRQVIIHQHVRRVVWDGVDGCIIVTPRMAQSPDMSGFVSKRMH